MTLSPGSRLGPYEIQTAIGAGGMGEVYRARDLRLNRDVAIKVLPPAFAADAGRLRRFEQEARAAAALNHPNILAVHDVGFDADGQPVPRPYLVSELLDGSSLRERLGASGSDEGGGLPLRKAIDYATQIAHGLAAAHVKGIVHRDLKPENVFVTADGRVKILDFGLAKLAEGQPDVVYGSSLPTVHPSTDPGTVLGTMGYMAPEQVRGQHVDHRADIFAFGAILYEMCAGQRAFEGETAADTIAAILDRDPPDQALTTRQVPPALARTIDRCLEKSPAARFQTASDLAFALEGLSAQSGADSATNAAASGIPLQSRTSNRWRAAAIALAAVLVGAAAAIITTWRPTPPAPLMMAHVEIVPPEEAPATTAPNGHNVAFSPDGSTIVYQVPRGRSSQQLYARRLDETDVRPIPGTEGAAYPFFSPDSRQVGFVVNSQIKWTSISGGPVGFICQLPESANPSWGPDGYIYFSNLGTSSPFGLFRVPATGGTPQAVVAHAPDAKENYFAPQLLPDGDTLLFHFRPAGPPTTTALDDTGVAIRSLKTGEEKILARGGIRPRYLASGHLVYATHLGLMAAAFDLGKRELTSTPVPVLEGTVLKSASGPLFSISDSGSLVYLPPTREEAPPGKFIWLNREGKPLGPAIPETLLNPRYPRISPDGRSLAATVGPVDEGQIWIYDLTGSAPSRKLTFKGHNTEPAWSPEGTHIAYAISGPDVNPGTGGIHVIAADGSDAEGDQLFALGRRPQFAADGRWMLLDAPGNALALVGRSGRAIDAARGARAGAPPVSGSRGAAEQTRTTRLWKLDRQKSEASLWLGTTFFEIGARFSPHSSQFVAYVTDSTGNNEVWVRPFPGPGPTTRVSDAGGIDQVWSRDGKEIFYQHDGRLIAKDVSVSGGNIILGGSRVLVDGGFRPWSTQIPGTYDVHPDGRFLMITPQPTVNPTRQRMVVILNWAEHLKRITQGKH